TERRHLRSAEASSRAVSRGANNGRTASRVELAVSVVWAPLARLGHQRPFHKLRERAPNPRFPGHEFALAGCSRRRTGVWRRGIDDTSSFMTPPAWPRAEIAYWRSATTTLAVISPTRSVRLLFVRL